jgi:hypothetical protein
MHTSYSGSLEPWGSILARMVDLTRTSRHIIFYRISVSINTLFKAKSKQRGSAQPFECHGRVESRDSSFASRSISADSTGSAAAGDDIGDIGSGAGSVLV